MCATILVTAIVTAIATAMTARFAALSYRLVLRSTSPIVECDDPRWENGQILFRFDIRNQTGQAFRLRKCRILKPRKGKVSLDDDQTIPQSSHELNREIFPAGSAIDLGASGPALHLDRAGIKLFVSPPSGWSCGEVRIELI